MSIIICEHGSRGRNKGVLGDFENADSLHDLIHLDPLTRHPPLLFFAAKASVLWQSEDSLGNDVALDVRCTATDHSTVEVERTLLPGAIF